MAIPDSYVKSFIPLNQKNFLLNQLTSVLFGNTNFTDINNINYLLDNPFAGNPSDPNDYYVENYTAAAQGMVNFMNNMNTTLLETAGDYYTVPVFGPSGGAEPTNSGSLPFYRLVCTVPDGTVWFDSSLCGLVDGSYTNGGNTYTAFLAGTISSKHNDRCAFLQALLSDAGIGYEEKTARVKPTTSTITYSVRELRVALRVGQSKTIPVGIVALTSNYYISPVIVQGP